MNQKHGILMNMLVLSLEDHGLGIDDQSVGTNEASFTVTGIGCTVAIEEIGAVRITNRNDQTIFFADVSQAYSFLTGMQDRAVSDYDIPEEIRHGIDYLGSSVKISNEDREYIQDNGVTFDRSTPWQFVRLSNGDLYLALKMEHNNLGHFNGHLPI